MVSVLELCCYHVTSYVSRSSDLYVWHEQGSMAVLIKAWWWHET